MEQTIFERCRKCGLTVSEVHITAVSRLQFWTQHVKHCSNNIKTSSVHNGCFDSDRGTSQTARQPITISDMPGIQLIVRQPDCWSFRQLIKRYYRPHSVRQSTTDQTEICPHFQNWSEGTSLGLNVDSVHPALDCYNNKLNIFGFGAVQ